MIRIKKNEQVTIIFYLIASSIYYISSTIWGMSNSLRHVGILLAIVQGFISVVFKYRNKDIKKIKGKNLLWIFFFYLYLIFASIMVVKENSGILSNRVWIQTGYILIPALYAFCLINLLSFETILELIKYTFILGIVLYIIKTGPTAFFSLSNWKALSFSSPDTDAIFESSTFTMLFIVSYFFFYYYKILKNQNNKNNKIFFYFALFFSILGWKRLGVVYVIFMLLLLPVLKKNKKIFRIVPLGTGILFGIVTAYYTKFMQGIFNPLNLNVYQFSTGRDYILSLWKQYGYVSYGYGSSYEIIHRYLELDLVQMYLEVGIVAVVLFGLCYFNLTKKSLFAYIVMVYEFLNLLTASSFPSVFEWVLVLVLIEEVTQNINLENKEV